jgi:hypothetical protein
MDNTYAQLVEKARKCQEASDEYLAEAKLALAHAEYYTNKSRDYIAEAVGDKAEQNRLALDAELSPEGKGGENVV